MNIAKPAFYILTLFSFVTAFAADVNPADVQIGTDENNGKEVTLLAENEAKANALTKAENELEQLGFGPALYLIQYKDEVLKDAKDVKIRGDGTLSSNGSQYSITMGVELHYDFSFWHSIKCYMNCNDPNNWNVTSSHRISPFLGLFDVENGINGMTAGFIYGYTRGDGKGENKTTLNFGAGWIVHKDRLVLSNDVMESAAPPASLNAEDYTERKDVKGYTVMVSANFGF